MISKELLDLAFAYRKTALWEKIGDRDIFAFRLETGEPVLVAVMGKIGEHCAIAAYPGNRGLKPTSAHLRLLHPTRTALSALSLLSRRTAFNLNLPKKTKCWKMNLRK